MLPIKRHIPLAPFTTFQIGGQADFFVDVSTVAELTEAMEYAGENHLRTFVLSGGSNLLVADQGFPGLVIRMTNQALRVSGETIFVDGGTSLLAVVEAAGEHNLAGMERLAGIPGSLGGAIRGNAGAFGMEIKDVVRTVKAFDRTDGTLHEFSRAECHFTYRSSYFKTHPDLIILSAVLGFTLGEKAELEKVARETIEQREAKHPQKAKCAGSFFMNPIVTDEKLLSEFEHETGKPSKNGKLPAGWLIDHAGLRGKKVGGAMVSPQHPNYLVNTGTATAQDVIILASLVKQRVRTELGVQLREEVQYVGF